MAIVKENYFLERAALGSIPGASILDIYGVNAASTTSYDTIWANSNAYTFVTTAIASPTIVSSSANDTAAGTGARTVRITGVNASYETITEDAELAGATPVALTGAYITINDITVLTAGSGGVTAGNLTLAGTGPVTHGFVLAGQNRATSAIYCVPANYIYLVFKVDVQMGGNSSGAVQWKLAYSTNGGLVYNVGPLYKEAYTQAPCEFRGGLYLPEKTQFRVDQLSASVTVCSVHIRGVLINKAYNVLGT